MHPAYLLDACARYAVFAFRTVLRNKGAYLAATGILALGIGMSVAMFSLVDAVLLRPLPFPHQESIEVIWKADPLAGNHVVELAYPELRDLQERTGDFGYVAVMPTSLYGYARVLQSGSREPVQIESSPVSHDFFRVLGVAPVLGRGFTGSDERVGAPPVVVLSNRVWREQFSADPGIVGRLIRLNGEGTTVIGVMGPSVEFPRGAGLWIPLGVEPRLVERRSATFLQAIARAMPGFGRERIAGDVNALFRTLAREHPDAYTPSQRGVVTPLAEYWTGSARLHLSIMLGAALLLFLASAIGAGSLLLSRTVARRPEIATRVALGARRSQVFAQLGAESAMVATAAVVAGLAIAELAIRFLVRLAPGDIPRLPDAALNLRAFGVAAAAAALAAVACTVIPGWAAIRMNVESALREGGARLSPSRRARRARNLFVLAQAALTMMLLATASLLVLSYRSMMSADIGFANRDALSMNLQLRGPGLFSSKAFGTEYRRLFYTRLLNRLREAPGVTSAAAVLLRPLEGTIGWDVPYDLQTATAGTDARVLPAANYEVVTPGYFRTVGTPLLEGRDFDEHDTGDTEPVVIVSQALARRMRAEGFTLLGHRIRLGLGCPGGCKVVGVSADARYRGVTQPGIDVYVPYLQASPPTNYIVVRGKQSAENLTALTRRTLAEIDPSQAVAGVATIGELIDRNTARHRFSMSLLLWFAVCAAVLAAMGVYSVTAEAMAARTREIAIRNALGARRGQLLRQMTAGALCFVLTGESLGAALICATGQSSGLLNSGLLYEVSARDPRVLGSVAAFLFLVSLGAALGPAWFAAGSDPTASLRAE